jgi:hypothetical protein
VTYVRVQPRSPEGLPALLADPLRAGTGPSLPPGGGAAKPVTQRNRDAGAAERVQERCDQARRLLAAGHAKDAFNAAVAVWRVALAREYRRRPQEAAGLYAYFADLLIAWALAAPELEAVDDGQPGQEGELRWPRS